MPKRKRPIEEEVDQSFEKYTKDLFRALKAAKGFERQRLAKRIKEPKLDEAKLRRLDQEVSVLKSLDLHQAAHAHLCSSLLKVKAAAQSPYLPARLKSGVPKPSISEEERAALHNVTSALYKRNQVRNVVGQAIPALCGLLGVSPPGAKSKGQADATPTSKHVTKQETADPGEPDKNGKAAKENKSEVEPSKERDRERRKQGAPKRASSDSSSPEQSEDGSEGADGDLDEEAISRMEAMLGGSSSESEDSGGEIGGGVKLLAQKARGSRSFDDDISLPGSDSVPEEDPFGSESVSSGSSSEAESVASSSSAVAPPRKKEKSSDTAAPPAKSKDKAVTKAARATNSTFLPTLMGGYVSGSESASDVDVAPPVRKNRRGQKARQAIWEKKYGDKAKHLGKADSRRDSGWDAKRGAVEAGGDDGKPWKRGVRNPLRKTGDEANDAQADKKPEKAEKKRDDAGPLHPSWEARKKAKQAQANASFQGKKIVFD